MSRYRNDPDFRKAVKSSNRKSARRHYGLNTTSLSDRLKDVSKRLESYGTTRQILLPDKSVVTEVCFTVAEMCKVVGRCQKTFNFWIADERFPKPTCITFKKCRGIHKAVYSMEHTLQLVNVLIDHYADKHTLAVEDTETRKKLLTIVYGTNAVITHTIEDELKIAA